MRGLERIEPHSTNRRGLATKLDVAKLERS